MAHVIQNTTGIQLSPTGQIPAGYNYISEYDYTMQYEPDRILKLHSKYGNGLITGFARICGMEKSYSSDVVKHAEEGRLMQITEGASRVGSTFTTTEAHNLRVGDIIKVSDGVTEDILDVSAKNSTTEFEALSRKAAGISVGAADLSLYAFSSDFAKGSKGFQEGRTWEPEYFDNFSQTIKEQFNVPDSDRAHDHWVKTDSGEGWFNYDMDRTYNLMQNKIELTHIFMERAEAGSAVAAAGGGGMNGVVPTLRGRGNVGNGLITTLGEMDEIIYRLQKQGNCSSYTVWCDSRQLVAFTEMLASQNKFADTGANYGTFKNSKELAVYLDFHSFVRQGITFHLTPWRVLIDPTLDGGTGFADTSVQCMFVPDGQKTVYNTDDRANEDSPYFSVRHRASQFTDRRLKTKMMGTVANPIDEDMIKVQHIAEQTNQVIGANEWYLVNR